MIRNPIKAIPITTPTITLINGSTEGFSSLYGVIVLYASTSTLGSVFLGSGFSSAFLTIGSPFKYSEEKATNSSNVSTLKNEKKQLEKELETLKKENDELKGGDSGTNLKDSYEALALAIRYFYDKKDYLKTAQSLKKVNVDSVENASLKKLYNTMKDDTYKQASTKLFEQGRNAYNGQGEYVGKKDYDKAIEILTIGSPFK